MNLRRKQPPDSLYLLLDTLCNAFGAIVLLAVLVVLLTSKEKSKSEKPSASQAALQRELALAQTNLQASLKLKINLEAQAGDASHQQVMALLETRKELQTSLQQAADTIEENRRELETAGAADPTERLKFLNAEKAKALVQQQEARSGLAAVDVRIQQLKQQLAEQEAKVKVKFNSLKRTVRLPKEHFIFNKRIVYIIARHGRLYPCHDAKDQRIETDINWTISGDRQTADPIAGKGISPEQTAAFCAGFPQDQVYFAFLVYEDSFPAFIKAKQLIVDAGTSYGWEPINISDGLITISTSGNVPMGQ